MSTDPIRRRLLTLALRGAGFAIDHDDDDADSDEPHGEPDLVVIDRHESDADIPQLLRDSHQPTIMVGGSLEDESILELLREGLDHVIGDEPTLGGDHLLVTTAKLLNSDVFGLEKYLAWGVTVHEIEISSYLGKREAIKAIRDYASSLGANRAVRRRIEAVADELLMNAMYDAPAVSRGDDARPREAARSGDTGEPVLMRFACDGRCFALSVEDRHGALEKRAILDNVARARREQGAPKMQESGGAGLGLYYVLSYATRFIANIARGERTEVVCLFELGVRPAKLGSCARSLDVFRTGSS